MLFWHVLYHRKNKIWQIFPFIFHHFSSASTLAILPLHHSYSNQAISSVPFLLKKESVRLNPCIDVLIFLLYINRTELFNVA